MLILALQRPSAVGESDGPCPLDPWRKPLHVRSQSNTAEVASQPSPQEKLPKAQREPQGFRGGDRGKLLEVGQGAMSMQLGQAGANRLKAGPASMEGLSSHPGAATLHPAGNMDVSFKGGKKQALQSGR